MEVDKSWSEEEKWKSACSRFQQRYVIDDETGCWNWNHSKNPLGYGTMWALDKNRLAHRISFQMYRGSIPENMCVCHTCDNPSCVNPEHLWLGTQDDNAQDKIQKGRQREGKNHQYYGLKGENHPAHGYRHSDEAKRDMSLNRMGAKNHMFGKKRSLESIEKQRQQLIGRPSPKKGKPGVAHTEESKALLRQKALEAWQRKRAKTNDCGGELL